MPDLPGFPRGFYPLPGRRGPALALLIGIAVIVAIVIVFGSH